MVIFYSYVSLPEGINYTNCPASSLWRAVQSPHEPSLRDLAAPPLAQATRRNDGRRGDVRNQKRKHVWRVCFSTYRWIKGYGKVMMVDWNVVNIIIIVKYGRYIFHDRCPLVIKRGNWTSTIYRLVSHSNFHSQWMSHSYPTFSQSFWGVFQL